MPKARNKKERIQQILNYFLDQRPCGRPVSLRWVKWTGKRTKHDYGDTYRRGSELVVRLNEGPGKCTRLDVSLDILIHEYAHCRLWGMAALEASDLLDPHDHVFWSEFGHLYNLYHYNLGWKYSKEYEVEG